MGAYPALSIQQPENPINNLSRLVALKSMLQNQQYQQQMQPLQLQQSEAANEQQQLQLNSEKAIMRAYNDSGGDLGKASQLAAQYGALPKDVVGLHNLDIDMQQKLQNLDKTKLDNANTEIQQMGQGAGMLLSVPKEQRPQVFQEQVAPMLKIDPSKLSPDQLNHLLDDDTLKYTQMRAVKASDQINQIREEKGFQAQHGVLPDDKLAQVNQALVSRYQVLHPGQNIPSQYQLPQGATVDDFNRVDKLMEQTEKAQATKAQRDTANGFRAQAAALANLAAQEKIAQLNKPTADEQRRADLASNLEENLGALQDIVKRRPELFGSVGGRLTGLKQFVGTDDPDIGALETIKHQLGMAQISAHGMRSAQGIANAAQSILNSFKNGPDAINGSINSALNSVQTFKANEAASRSGERTGITQDMVPGHKQAKSADYGDAGGKPEGATGTLPDGTKVIVRGGRIVKQ